MRRNNQAVVNHPLEKVMVLPIDRKKLIAHLKTIRPIGEHDDYLISEEALIVGTCITTDTEAIHAIATPELTFEGGEPEIYFELGIRVEKYAGTSESGSVMRNIPMFHEFIFKAPISKMKEMGFMKPETSMREFMGSRFNYNPRIVSNQQLLLENIKNNLTTSHAQ